MHYKKGRNVFPHLELERCRIVFIKELQRFI